MDVDYIIKKLENYKHTSWGLCEIDVSCLLEAIRYLKKYNEPKSRVIPYNNQNVTCCEHCGKVMLDVYRYCPDCGYKLIWYGANPILWEEMGKYDTEKHCK